MDKEVSFSGNVEWKPSLSGVLSDRISKEVRDLRMKSGRED